MPTSASTRFRAAALTLVLVLSACLDAPTIPESVQQIAGGEAWLAIPEPRSLPTLETWMPYVASGEREDGPRARIAALVAEAREARYDGQLGWASELDREALRIAVLSLERSPDPLVLSRSLASISEWVERVGSGVDLRVYSDVASSLRRVERSRGFAESALEAGDTATAVIQISSAAEAIRGHGPTAVALRVLGLAEDRLRAEAPGEAVLDRAVHLIRSARAELVDGDPSRALRRALYALQLAEGT